MYYFPNVDPIYIYKRKGTEDDPFIPIIDRNNVRSGAIVLKEIPHFEEKVEAYVNGVQLTEVQTEELSVNEFRVDYTTGVAYFNQSRNSQEVRLEYLGTGYVSVPASRIWMIGDIEDPVESLEEVLDRVDEGVAVLDGMSDFSFQGEYSNNSQYRKWNFVFYNNKTYVAIENVSDEKPDESSKWRLVSSGVGFAGVFQDDKTYRVGDIVADPNLKNIYFSKIDNNTDLLDEPNSWELMLSMEDIIDVVTDKMNEVDDFLHIISDAEDVRNQKETGRQEAFDDLLLDVEAITDIIQAEEEVRDLNETQRQQAETNRFEAELLRESEEQVRKDSEQARVNAEEAREQLFQQLDSSIQNALNDAVTSIENANQILEDTRGDIANALNNLDDKETIIFGELERIGNFRYVGEYDPDREYKKENIVKYDGQLYIALEDSEGDEIADESVWEIYVQKALSNINISIDGVSPDESGEISLDELDIVRNAEYEERNNEIDEIIGELSSLNTLHKSSLVGAINELKNRIDDIISVLE